MDIRKPLDTGGYVLVVFFCMAMGLQSISLKAIGAEVTPIMQIGLRSGVAAILVGLYMWLSGENLTLLRQVWKPGMLSGLFFAVEYVFVGEALRFTTAARVTVFMYTAPLFTALILHFFRPSERLSGWQWVGVFITFSGMVAAFWEFTPESGKQTHPYMLFGDILAIIGGVLWALTTVTLRLSRLASTSGTITLFYQLVLTFLILMVAGAVLGQIRFELTGLVAINFAYQILIVAFGCMLLWLWLIRVYAATRIGILSFLTPLFSIVFAILLLGETVAINFIFGAILVVSGLIIVSLSKNTAAVLKKKVEIPD